MKKPNYVNNRIFSTGWAYKETTVNNDKAKPAERRGRKATGPCFLREAKDDSYLLASRPKGKAMRTKITVCSALEMFLIKRRALLLAPLALLMVALALLATPVAQAQSRAYVD